MRHWSLKKNVDKRCQGMAFQEILPERRLTQFKGTEGMRGRAFQAVARWGEKHTHHRVDICPK